MMDCLNRAVQHCYGEDPEETIRRLRKLNLARLDEITNRNMEYSKLETQLRTAESIVRALAKELQVASIHLDLLGRDTDHIRLVLSRIPAHLRAPETTSTGESSSVLRQEDL